MQVGYNNAERLIRTELNYIRTRAAADSIISAEMGYYQFIAVMDNRTTPMCQELDGKIIPIIELNQGENAPPMHVRCRSTIAASEDDGRQGRKPVGQRAARNEEGKRIKIPADMTYRDWKAVYIDKTRTLEDWRKAKDAEYAAQRKNVVNLARRTSNLGAFAHLEVPMQKKVVKQICKDYGVDISFIRIKLQRDENLLCFNIAGSAAPENVGRIDLFPKVFANEEQLLRTVIHEGCHVKQFLKYGAKYVQENQAFMERIAYRYENFFFRIVKKRVRYGK